MTPEIEALCARLEAARLFTADRMVEMPASLRDEAAAKLREMAGALEAVQASMLKGGDGAVGDFGWSITKLNKARPFIRTALTGGSHG